MVAWRGRKHVWGQIWASNGAGKMGKMVRWGEEGDITATGVLGGVGAGGCRLLWSFRSELT